MPLQRVIYRSTNAIGPKGARALIHFNDIVSTSRHNNKKVEICGFLMFDRVNFWQILEGEVGAVDRLYDKIKSDARHRDIVCLSREQIETRSFPEWSMATLLGEPLVQPALSDGATAFLSDLSAADFLAFAKVQVRKSAVDK